jgi:hypothetical protein
MEAVQLDYYRMFLYYLFRYVCYADAANQRAGQPMSPSEMLL